MMFSLVIPVYNVAPYLRACLDSVLSQSCADWEAVCVDDGSVDGSGAVLDEYAAKDGRFRVVHKMNEGVSVARNKAIEIAKGEYVGFVDADDAIAKDWLRHAKECIEKEDADVVRFEMQRWGGGIFPGSSWNGEYSVLFEKKSLIEWGWPKYLSGNCGGPCNVFARRYIVKNYGTFPMGMRMKEDRIFLLRLLMHTNKMVISDYQGYYYRRRDSGACGKKRDVSDVVRYMDELQRLAADYIEEVERVGAIKSFRNAMTWTAVNDVEELMEYGDLEEWHNNSEIPARLVAMREKGLLSISNTRLRYIPAVACAVAFGSMAGFAVNRKLGLLARKFR